MTAPMRTMTTEPENKGSVPLCTRDLQKIDALWRASNYLSVGQIYLLDNPLLRKPLAREHIKPRLLGHWGTTPGLNFLYAHLNRVIKQERPEHDLRDRPRARRARARRARVSRRDLQRGLPEHRAGRGRDAEAVQAVQLPGRHPEPRGAGDARLDPRGRRARLCAVARVRRGVRQSRPDRRVRRRRRRGRDRTARDGLARQQVPEPGARRLRAADPAPERLQDRQPVLPGAHPEGRAHEVLRGLRLQALLRRGRRARGDAPGDGRDARPASSPRSSGSRPTRASAAW